MNFADPRKDLLNANQLNFSNFENCFLQKVDKQGSLKTGNIKTF